MSEEQERLEIAKLESEVQTLLISLNGTMTQKLLKTRIYINHLKSRKRLLEWTSKKQLLQKEGKPNKVEQRDVFYCDLGYNLGSEQNDDRPIVILQNNKGNLTSDITIVAPVSTHQSSEIYEYEGRNHIKYFDEHGGEHNKRLDYYEIPIILESGYTQVVMGYINVAQIRTISMKRLRKHPVGKITFEVFGKVKSAMTGLLR